MFKSKTQLAAKIETVEGVPEALAGVDVLLVANPSFKPNTPPVQRDNTSQTMSQSAAVMGLRSATMGFDIELKGSGTPGTAPEYGKLLKMCGFSESIVASPESVTYLPTSTYGGNPVSIPSGTLGFYMDGVLKKIWGARGDVSLKLDTGKFGVLSFKFTGADFSVTDAALLSAGVSYQTTKPPVFMNANFTMDSYAAILSVLEIKMANVVTLRDSANALSGYLSAIITGRKPTMTFDPEMVLVASYDFYGKLRSNNEGVLSTVLGATSGNIIAITAPKVQYTGINPADRGGINTLGMDCQLNKNAGDDELSIVLT